MVRQDFPAKQERSKIMIYVIGPAVLMIITCVMLAVVPRMRTRLLVPRAVLHPDRSKLYAALEADHRALRPAGEDKAFLRDWARDSGEPGLL
jgi:hypothetical protein